MTLCQLQFVCGKAWDDLKPLNVEQARYCNDCQKAVFMAKTLPELHLASALGRCVGIADDNNFIGVIGEPEGGGFNWMEPGFFEGLTVRLSTPPSAGRLEQLRLLFPKLFDGGTTEQLLLAGAPTIIAELGPCERELLQREISSDAPEILIANPS